MVYERLQPQSLCSLLINHDGLFRKVTIAIHPVVLKTVSKFQRSFIMIYVGIDVAKDKHEPNWRMLFKAFTITNNLDGFNELHRWMNRTGSPGHRITCRMLSIHDQKKSS